MKILMINYFEGGAGIVLYDLHKLNKNSEYVNVYSKLNFIPLKFRFMLAKLIAPFYSLILQITNNYDEVIMNNNIVIPIGRNSKCVYKNIIHHPFIYDIELHNRKKNFFHKNVIIT